MCSTSPCSLATSEIYTPSQTIHPTQSHSQRPGNQTRNIITIHPMLKHIYTNLSLFAIAIVPANFKPHPQQTHQLKPRPSPFFTIHNIFPHSHCEPPCSPIHKCLVPNQLKPENQPFKSNIKLQPSKPHNKRHWHPQPPHGSHQTACTNPLSPSPTAQSPWTSAVATTEPKIEWSQVLLLVTWV